jgi:hypothetical protein
MDEAQSLEHFLTFVKTEGVLLSLEDSSTGSLISSVLTLTLYNKVHFNVSLPSTSRYTMWSFPTDFLTTVFYVSMLEPM